MKISSSMNYGRFSNESNLKSSGSLDSNLRWKPICHCGDMDVLRKASTVTNFRIQFWGCRHYKVRTNPNIFLFAGYSDIDHLSNTQGATQPSCGYFD